jgi:hypothetical protein
MFDLQLDLDVKMGLTQCCSKTMDELSTDLSEGADRNDNLV